MFIDNTSACSDDVDGMRILAIIMESLIMMSARLLILTILMI